MSAQLPAAGPSRPPERCTICLAAFADRSTLRCGHEFCFACIGVWANHSRRCPLCNAQMGEYLEHALDTPPPTKFFLPPLPSPFAPRPLSPSRKVRADAAALAHRREIYARGLWAKHIASNPYTGFRPAPSPRELDAASAGRARAFLAREMRVWYDQPRPAEIAGEHVLALLSTADIRSPVAVPLLEPIVGPHAEHLAHELYSFLRSPFAALEEYDEVVSYAEAEAFPEARRARSRSRSRSRSWSVSGSERSWSRSRSRSRSRSLSPYSDDSRSPHSPRSPARDPARADTFTPAPARGERRWDQPDTWLDPEYARELAAADKRRRRRDQRTRQRERRRAESAAGAGGGIPKGERREEPRAAAAGALRALAGAGIAVRGAAERRQSLLERLAKAKGEAVRGEAAAPPEDGAGGTLLSRLAPAEPEPSRAAASAAPAANGAGSAEERASELRARLIAERKRKVLREQLMARKRAKAEPAPPAGEEASAPEAKEASSI